MEKSLNVIFSINTYVLRLANITIIIICNNILIILINSNNLSNVRNLFDIILNYHKYLYKRLFMEYSYLEIYKLL